MVGSQVINIIKENLHTLIGSILCKVNLFCMLTYFIVITLVCVMLSNLYSIQTSLILKTNWNMLN